MTHTESLDACNVSGNVTTMGYTKLFSSLVMSSVWRAPDHVRIVWITMLALKDERGEVRGSAGGLSDAARVSREMFEDAVRVLESPDPDSSNPENEGRRIERIVGGWFVLNHSHYNRLMSADDIRAKNAERQRRFRQSRQPSRDVTDVTDVTPSDQIRSDQNRSDQRSNIDWSSSRRSYARRRRRAVRLAVATQEQEQAHHMALRSRRLGAQQETPRQGFRDGVDDRRTRGGTGEIQGT